MQEYCLPLKFRTTTLIKFILDQSSVDLLNILCYSFQLYFSSTSLRLDSHFLGQILVFQNAEHRIGQASLFPGIDHDSAPSLFMSTAMPTISVVMTGFPQAMASRGTIPKPSLAGVVEGSTNSLQPL